MSTRHKIHISVGLVPTYSIRFRLVNIEIRILHKISELLVCNMPGYQNEPCLTPSSWAIACWERVLKPGLDRLECLSSHTVFTQYYYYYRMTGFKISMACITALGVGSVVGCGIRLFRYLRS